MEYGDIFIRRTTLFSIPYYVLQLLLEWLSSDTGRSVVKIRRELRFF